MNIIHGTLKGFFGNCNDAARHISHCLANNEEWFVDWKDDTLYYDPKVGNNVWEYFFKQTFKYKEPNKRIGDFIELALQPNSTPRETMHFLYKNYFIFNDKFQEHIGPHTEFFDKNRVLGVHIRRTDKFLLGAHGTTKEQLPVDLEIFQNEIDNVIKDYDAIYLATDCRTACAHMKKIYGSKIIFNHNAIRGDHVYSIHDNFKNISGHVKALDVLTDAYFLSKCKHLIWSSSNVSLAALYFNLNLTHLNLNVKYQNDTIIMENGESLL